MDTRPFKYLWCRPTIADCKHCTVSTKVFRHFRNRPFDAWYICKVGNDRTECNGEGYMASTVDTPAVAEVAPKLEAAVSKRDSAYLNQDEINAMVEAAKK